MSTEREQVDRVADALLDVWHEHAEMDGSPGGDLLRRMARAAISTMNHNYTYTRD